MSAGTHTPGPWQIKPSIEGGGLCIYAGEYGIGKAWDLNGRPENRANARLIAAAPDMLAALKNVLNSIEVNDDKAVLEALAAIAKAEGRA